MLSDDNLELYVKYCHIQLHEQNILVASALAANLFEHYIHRTTNYKFTRKNTNYPLGDAIKAFVENERKYKFDYLDKLREHRNDLVHKNLTTIQKQHSTTEVLNFLEVELFGEILEYLNSFERQHIIEQLKAEDLLAGEKSLKLKLYQTIDESDFFNLYDMRDKFLYLKKKLLNYQKLKEIGLVNASVSHVDGTSGYVWLSLYSDLNQKFEQLSLSILATPESLRIYIDFGGKAFELRKQYIDLFKNEDFINVIRRDPKNDDLYIFDIEWYHSIVKQHLLKDFFWDNVDVDRVLNRLAEDKISKNTITWNKYLMGFIFPRDQINQEAIDHKIMHLIELFKMVKKGMEINT